MNINPPTPSQVPYIRSLWEQAFGDFPTFWDSFFSTAFSADHCRCLTIDGTPRAALYWFDAAWEDKKLAYFYAVATDRDFQKQGFCRQLMENAHTYLNSIGYAGVVLVPANDSLFGFYQKLGYRAFGPVNHFSCSAGESPAPLQKCSAEEYAALRQQYLPKGSVVQKGVILNFLETQTVFYAGSDFLLCCYTEDGELHTQEFLGNTAAAPGILKTLSMETGQFRMPGEGSPAAMFYPFSPMDATPTYLGLPLDM